MKKKEKNLEVRSRRTFLWINACGVWLLTAWHMPALGADASSIFLSGFAQASVTRPASGEMPATLFNRWLAGWEKSVLAKSRNRYCDRENGEQIGWLISPFLNGFYYGFAATGDPKWANMFMDWTHAWIRRGIVEPDGYVGWPKPAGASTQSVPDWYTDSLLGEAMGFRPVVLMADAVLRQPAQKANYGQQAASYIHLSERIFEKWDKRGCWREVNDGGLWAVPPFGINRQTWNWTEGYGLRYTDGFSNPANKQNLIARWLIALYGVTGKTIYKDRAEKWWRLMK